MSNLRKISSNRAITLIALIITIVVMLILVAITVSILVESDLIGSAEKAGNSYKTVYEEESTMGIKINGITYQSMEDYLLGSPHDWKYVDESTRESVKCMCTECTKVNVEGITYAIGQPVTYTDNGIGSSTITGDKSGVTQGIKDGKLTASDFGENGLQTIRKDANTTWVVFGIEDRNGSGESETLLLTTATPTTETIITYGAKEYKYIPEEIDRMCKEIYGEDARGMTIEDVNRTLGFVATGGMYMDGKNFTFHTLNGFDTTFSSLYSSLGLWDDIQLLHETNYGGKYYTPDYPDGTTNASVLGNVQIDGYTYTYGPEHLSSVYDNMPYTPAETGTAVRNLVFGANNTLAYILASRGAQARGNVLMFGAGYVSNGLVGNAANMFLCEGSSGTNHSSIRPIISLISVTGLQTSVN